MRVPPCVEIKTVTVMGVPVKPGSLAFKMGPLLRGRLIVVPLIFVEANVQAVVELGNGLPFKLVIRTPETLPVPLVGLNTNLGWSMEESYFCSFWSS